MSITRSDKQSALRGGLIPEQGNVELCINGGWTEFVILVGTITMPWVVCRQLGLPATGNNIIHSSTKKILASMAIFVAV